MNTHDTTGRPWAKLSELKAGDWIELDSGFTCHGPGKVQLWLDKDGDLAFSCSQVTHAIFGQADDGEHCIGIYGPIL